MKKVLFVATVASHIKGFHEPYLKLFKEKGYKTYVIANWNLDKEEKINYCDEFIQIPIQRSPIKINNLKAIKQIKKIIDEEKFEIIHCHTPMGGVVTRLASIKARKNGTRVIYTAHGFHFYKGAPLLNWLIYYPIEKFLSRYTDTLITINQEDYDIASKKFHAKRTELVHGVGVDETRFNFEMTPEEKSEYRKSLGLKDDDFVMIYVAELIKRKNQIMAINAMHEIVKEKPNAKLLLVGDGKLENYYKSKIEEYNLKDNVLMLGYRKDVPKLMKISDLAISTSRQEGLPVNIMEAMCAGLPVVATDCRGNRDLVKKDCLVEINDVEELKNKILSKKFDSNSDVEKFELGKVKEEYKMIYFNR